MRTVARLSLSLSASALAVPPAHAQYYPQPQYPQQPYSYGYNGSAYGNWNRLVGSDFGNARYQLSRSGFRQVDSFNAGRRREGSVWSSDRSGQCLQVIAFRGRVESVSDIRTNPRCGGYQNMPIGGGGGSPWLDSLIGKGFNRADEQMRRTGFRQVDSFSTGPNSYATIWFNGSQCLQLTAVNGVLSGAADIGRHPRCR
jgi:hypothetical protein